MRPRRSLYEIKTANVKALRGLMALAGKEIDEADPVFRLPEPPKPRASRAPTGIPTEHHEQVTGVRWFRKQFPKVWIFAVPNAAVRDERLAAWMRAEGLTAGVPDLCVPAWNLWIEMKRRRGGTVSPDQAQWIAYLNSIGHTAIVCKGCEDAMAQVKAFIKVRGSRLPAAAGAGPLPPSAKLPPVICEGEGEKSCRTTEGGQ